MTELVTADWRGTQAPAAAGIVQRIDPAVRIVLAVGFALVVAAMRTLPALAAALAVASILAVLARLPPVRTLKRMAAADAFVLVVLVFLPFAVPGTALFAIGSLTASVEGVVQATDIVLTANAIVLAMLALVGTLEPVTLGHALVRLRTPDKIVHLLLFTVRYVDVLHREYGRLRLAMKARAFPANGGMHTWRSLGWLFGMLLVRSFERAERIHDAMKCRGFAGRYHLIDASRRRSADWWFSAAGGLVLIGLVAVEVLA